MTLVVEDGTAKADADSYCTVAFADSYHSDRGNAAWADLSDAEKEQALRKATDYLMLEYGTRWKGARQYERQALDWPRWGARVDGFDVGHDDVPKDVQKATASLALRASSGDIAPDITQQVKREKVDVVEVEYQDHSSAEVQFREIDGLLRKYLQGGANAVPILIG